jgi:hypothetical protein
LATVVAVGCQSRLNSRTIQQILQLHYARFVGRAHGEHRAVSRGTRQGKGVSGVAGEQNENDAQGNHGRDQSGGAWCPADNSRVAISHFGSPAPEPNSCYRDPCAPLGETTRSQSVKGARPAWRRQRTVRSAHGA